MTLSRVQFPRNCHLLLLRINTPQIYIYLAISYIKMIMGATDGDTLFRFSVLSCVENCHDYNLAFCFQVLCLTFTFAIRFCHNLKTCAQPSYVSKTKPQKGSSCPYFLFHLTFCSSWILKCVENSQQ